MYLNQPLKQCFDRWGNFVLVLMLMVPNFDALTEIFKLDICSCNPYNIIHSIFIFMKWNHITVTILIISGRSCFLLRRNTSSMISTPLPWTTRTLMQSISFQIHSWSSIVQCVTLSDISCLASKDCRSGPHGNTQCWTPGQWWCWWGSTAQARPPSSGTFWNRWDLPIRLSLEILTTTL